MSSSGPLRRFAALRDDDRSRSYRVALVGSSRERSIAVVLRESTERCSCLRLTQRRLFFWTQKRDDWEVGPTL
jgi:hypothetical protein